ncbi:MAG: FCD domain-containing protein [Acidimicrobiaceae bacterium]|nr:FCD domain-containing protein [Acidimicrobiaceae bacterium]
MPAQPLGASPAGAQTEDNRSATDRTIEGIVALIGAGELAAATRLPPESELAALMGVSRGSLREAVRVLAYLGIVDVRVGDGTYVTDLDGANLLRGFDLLGQVANEKTALEIFEIRRVLESAAAAMAASRITDEQLSEMEAHLKQMRSEKDAERFVRLDIQFHDLIASATGNVSLRMLGASFSARTQRARLMRGQNLAGILSRSTIEHDDIFRHIRNREPVLAAAAATSHIANVENWLRQEFAANSDGDTPDSHAGSVT